MADLVNRRSKDMRDARLPTKLLIDYDDDLEQKEDERGQARHPRTIKSRLLLHCGRIVWYVGGQTKTKHKKRRDRKVIQSYCALVVTEIPVREVTGNLTCVHWNQYTRG